MLGLLLLILSFFLGLRRPNLITGLVALRSPDSPLKTQEPVPDQRTEALPSLWQTKSNPRLVGKTDHNVWRFFPLFFSFPDFSFFFSFFTDPQFFPEVALPPLKMDE